MLGGLTGLVALASGCTGSQSSATSTSTGAGSTGGAPSNSPSALPTSTATAGPEEIAARATVPILSYHQLRDFTDADGAYSRQVLICPPSTFHEHLDAMQDDGWTTISPDEYHAYLTLGSPLPDKPVMLTFDDGWRSQIDEGLTQLVERDMTGAFFPMTVVLGNPDWMSTTDITRLADAGMTVGAHTWDHQMVSDLSGDDWQVQLEEPRELLRELSGQEVEHLAYPNGAWSTEALPHVAEAGYTTAFQLNEEPLDSDQPLLTLQRALVRSDWTGAQLLDHLRSQSGG